MKHLLFFQSTRHAKFSWLIDPGLKSDLFFFSNFNLNKIKVCSIYITKILHTVPDCHSHNEEEIIGIC